MFAFPTGAIQFTVFAGVKKYLTNIVGNQGATGTAVAMASSACASIASCAVGVPQEVLKQRLVTNIYPNFRTAVKTIMSTEGVKGFYTGWGPTVARNLPYVVITFTTFNHWKTQELKRRQSEGLDTASSLKFGMGSAVLGCIVTQPIDVVKTRMMTQAASNLIPYTSPFNCIADIIKTEGMGAFFAGFPPRVAYIAPLWAAQFMLNERLMPITIYLIIPALTLYIVFLDISKLFIYVFYVCFFLFPPGLIRHLEREMQEIRPRDNDENENWF